MNENKSYLKVIIAPQGLDKGSIGPRKVNFWEARLSVVAKQNTGNH